MNKIEIYSDMLSRSLCYIRNRQTWSWFSKAFDRTCYMEAELMHNITTSICFNEITDHDIYFLNNQAKFYLEKADPEKYLNYDSHKKNILKLFDLVPEHLKEQLKWHPSQLNNN